MKIPNQSVNVNRTSIDLTSNKRMSVNNLGIQTSQSKICSDCVPIIRRLKRCNNGKFTFTTNCETPTPPGGSCEPCFSVLTSERNCCRDIERETCLPIPIPLTNTGVLSPSIPIPPPATNLRF